MFDALLKTGQFVVNAFISNPVTATVVSLIAVTIIWFKWWLIARAQSKAIKANYAGWSVDAKQVQARHETGVGTTDVLIMKPIKIVPVALMTLAFFGGLAWFYWVVVLEKPEVSSKDWGVFAILVGFSALALLLLAQSFTRIRLEAENISRRSLFARRFDGKLSDVTTVKPSGMTIASGIEIIFNDGRKLRVRAQMSGYRQLLERLSVIDPKLRLMTRMIANAMQK